MKGTIINAIAIVGGSLIGLIFNRSLNKNLEVSIQKALGIAIVIVGFNGIITNMITVGANGILSSNGELLLVVSLVLGMLIGELLKIEERMNGFGTVIEKRFKLKSFSAGFLNASTIFCVGAMAIIGALQDGLTGDSSVLIIKSTLDFTCAIVLSASLGIGVIFSAIPVFIYQGFIAFLASYLDQILVGSLLNQVCMVGYAIILCIGINFIASTKIKTANLIPAIFIPIVYFFIFKM